MKLDLYNIDIFKKNKKTLKETSKDDNVDVVDLLDNAIYFDGVKNEYNSHLNLKQCPKSIDAVLELDNYKNIIFVEFKNGNIDSNELYEICKKIYDTLLIFSDITKKTIDFMRENIEFILVCNGAKFGYTIYTSFKSYPMLKSFEKYCFKKVSLLRKEDFVNFINSNR